MNFTISKGFSDAERPQVAALYWEAFAAKLRFVMGPDRTGLRFIAGALNPDFALVARNKDGAILGLAGFKTTDGSLVGGSFMDLARVYGFISTLWRAPLLSLVERDLKDGILLMDGICVAKEARGMGLGTALLDAIKEEAIAQGLQAVRLDVIDSNARARALYSRQGFEAVGQDHTGPFRYVFGFQSSTKMLWRINPQL